MCTFRCKFSNTSRVIAFDKHDWADIHPFQQKATKTDDKDNPETKKPEDPSEEVKKSEEGSPGSVDSDKTEIDERYEEKMDVDDDLTDTTAKDSGTAEEPAKDTGVLEGHTAGVKNAEEEEAQAEDPTPNVQVMILQWCFVGETENSW